MNIHLAQSGSSSIEWNDRESLALLNSTEISPLEGGAAFCGQGHSGSLKQIRIGFNPYEEMSAQVYWIYLEFAGGVKIFVERDIPPSQGFHLIWDDFSGEPIKKRIEYWECEELALNF